MRAIILAAGQGTRLRPLTDNDPKCMVPYNGRPLLHYQLDCLRFCGVDDIVIVGGFQADRIAAEGCRITTNPHFETTNMVETLFCARSFFDDDIIIAYGDIAYESKILQGLLESTAAIAVAVSEDWLTLWEQRMEDPLSDAETLRMDGEGRIYELGGRPTSLDDIEGQYMGLLKITEEGMSQLAALYDGLDRHQLLGGRDFEQMYMTDFLQAAIDAGIDVHGVPVSGEWVEVDSQDDLQVECRVVEEFPPPQVP